jgi:hypothetical protein
MFGNMRRRLLVNRTQSDIQTWHGPGALQLAMIAGTNRVLEPLSGRTGVARYNDVRATTCTRVFPPIQNFTSVVTTRKTATAQFRDDKAHDAFPNTSTPDNPVMASLAAMARY